MAARPTVVLGLALMCVLVVVVPAHGAFPGENGKLAFVRDEFVTDAQVYVRNPDGSGTQQLTSTGENFSPRWSANGQRITLVRRKAR